MREIDWIEQRRVAIHYLVEGTPGKDWKISLLRQVLRSEGKFRNPLIVTPAGKQFRVLVGSNRLHALRAEGMIGNVEVLVVGSVEGMIRAFSEYYTPKLKPDEVLNHIVSGSPD